jgi:transposase
MEHRQAFGRTQIEPDYKRILQYIGEMKKVWGEDTEIVCGYEAGCLGYSLYHSLEDHGVSCVILAPSTMATAQNERKTDYRDAEKIAKCLAFGTYSPVHVPTQRDEAVKEYIRMRDNHKLALKRVKQEIIALCHRHGKQYTMQSHWTQSHLAWLKALHFHDPILQETFEELLIQYHQMTEKLEYYDRRILDLSGKEEYAEKVNKLICFNGIREHTALSVIVEIGDFNRFPTAEHFAAYPGPCSRRTLQRRYYPKNRDHKTRELSPAIAAHRIRSMLQPGTNRKEIQDPESKTGRKRSRSHCLCRQSQRTAQTQISEDRLSSPPQCRRYRCCP